MKVLFMTNVPSPYRVDFFNELGKNCDLTVVFENDIAKSRNAAWKADKFTSFNAVFLQGIKVGEAEAVCLGIFKYLAKKTYDVIVAGMYSSPTGMLAIEYMRLKRIPFLISSDGGFIKEECGLRHMLKERYIGAASAWLSTGSVTTDYLCYYGAKKNKVYTYPFSSVRRENILEKPVSIEEKRKLRQELGMKEKRIILSVGQFIYRKGFDILLRASKDLADDIGIYIVGGEATREYLVLQKKLHLNNVHFVGFSRKELLGRYYKAADLFVLPTREDIWGLVVNEAMAHGLPVITTNKCIAGLEMIENGITGDIIPVENIQALAEKLTEQDRYNRERVLETATNYSIERMAERHIQIFKEITDTI